VKPALFVALTALFLLAAPRAPWSGADRARVATARSLAARGSLDVAFDGASPATVVRDGRRYARDGLLPALALAPAEALASLLPRAPSAAWQVVLVESAGAALCAALTCVLLFAGARRLGASVGASLASTALVAFSTTLAFQARVPDGSALAALLLLGAVQAARATTGSRSTAAAFFAGALGGLAAMIELEYALPALVLVAGATMRQIAAAHTDGGDAAEARSRAATVALAALGPLTAGVGLALLHRRVIGWQPLPGDLGEGLIGLLLSTGKSALLYNPPLVLAPFALKAMWRARRADAALTLAALLALLLATARLADWHGDPAWGPRRLLPLVPIALEPLAPWLDGLFGRARAWARVACVALGIAGLGVQALGAVFPPSEFLRLVDVVRGATGAPVWFGDQASECHFIPQFSPLVGQPWMIRHVFGRDRDGAADAPWRLLVPGTPKLDGEFPKLRADWWALEAPRAHAAALGGGLTLLALAGALGVWRSYRRRTHVLR